ncbi:MAG TPA: F0F1 ATP synthase subunit gamma [Woeseiaceae bacterium]|nr:F0F1 ATP synthase subunit gamma [Woeseiaceae bacterium]
MAQTLETLSRHRDTLTSIRGIVRTMKTLSAINATPYEHAATAIEAYHRTILEGFSAFAYRTGEIALRSDDTAGHLLVVFGSDHGLCGNYNEILAQAVKQHCLMLTDRKPRLLCVGVRMHDALISQNLSPEHVLLPPASAEGIGRLAGNIVTRLDIINRDQALYRIAVTLAFTQRGQQHLREPVTQVLLPLAPALLRRDRRWHSRTLPDYSMAPDALLASLIRSHIFASVFRASAEAMVTENSARLELMQQAEQSVDDRLEQVKGELRSVRQTEITDELMDVVISFEALKKHAMRNQSK